MSSIKWIKSSFDEEKGEFERVAKEYSPDKKSSAESLKYLKNAYSDSSPVTLKDSQWKKMENTESFKVTSIEMLQKQLRKDNVSRDVTRILRQMFYGEVQCPIVLQLEDGTLTLVAGNTRLMVSRMLQINPKVCIVKTDF